MSVLIKGMKLPKNCIECFIDEHKCLLWKEANVVKQRHKDCPLVEVKETKETKIYEHLYEG